MLSFLPGAVLGILAYTLTLINTLFWLTFLIPIAITKFVVRVKPVTKVCDVALNWICTTWANGNKFNVNLLYDIEWDLEFEGGVDSFTMDKWYLVLANHQSWADIIALQYALNGVIPYFRFFLKKELVWVPLLNIAWWALDYPYMTRYSKEFLEKNPHLKGKDLETTKKSCEKFRDVPVSIMNFVEGTRFREDKHERQNSPYQHLLRPSAGGVAFVLGALGEQLTSIIDVTIAYPEGRRNFWEFLCGKVPVIRLRLREVPITEDVLVDYFNNEDDKKRFQNWLNEFWEQKDKTMEELLNKS